MRVAIIGAGPTGLTSIKCCLDEGLQPVCFEKGSDLGGLWRYCTTEKDHTCVDNSCVMVTSKEMSCFSDFPIPKDYPLYLPHSLAYKYLSLYADRFNLRPYIRYHTKILKITHQRESNMNDQWLVTFKQTIPENSNETESDSSDQCEPNEDDLTTEMFDAVLVCSGHHWKPVIPKFVGEENFLGEIIHSVDYKDAKNYHGKNVLVIGIGDSAVGIATDLSHNAGQVYLSTRRGAWITSRLQSHGTPADQVMQRRVLFDLPRSILDWASMKLINHQFDHQDFGLLPKHSYLEQSPVVNDYLPYKIMSGAIIIKPDLVRLTDEDAHFEDGTVAKDIDLVITATGYKYEYPFMEDGAVEMNDNSLVLYKHMFRLEENPTLAFIGSLQPVGCMFPVAELQARVATRVFNGKIKLPNMEEMKEGIKKREEKIEKEFSDPRKNSTVVYLIPYCNELASILGCKPRLGTLLLSDPLLAYRCYFGPCSPPQYRLTGPGAWDGARQAIMELPERNHPMRKTVDEQNSGFWKQIFILVCALCIFIAVSYNEV